ncbi:hypothetical protein PR048_029638 [Dryococelus australis]|uniref:Uncharacterized protein n=1 Tax=Dryococelus australis TaxID=614101 RepID=A0ABQ9GDZ1_9NEOP|nr:hypothetical protein PR048_029638 [Dryococelus australis]
MRVIEVSKKRRRNEGGEKREVLEKTRRPTASFGRIPTCDNPVARRGVESANRSATRRGAVNAPELRSADELCDQVILAGAGACDTTQQRRFPWGCVLSRAATSLLNHQHILSGPYISYKSSVVTAKSPGMRGASLGVASTYSPGRIFPTSPTSSLLSHQHILSGPYISYKSYIVTAKSPGMRGASLGVASTYSPGRIFPTSPTSSLLSHQHILSGPYISYKFYVVTAKSPGMRGANLGVASTYSPGRIFPTSSTSSLLSHQHILSGPYISYKSYIVTANSPGMRGASLGVASTYSPGRIFPTSPTSSLLSHQHILSGPYISYKSYVVTAKSPGMRGASLGVASTYSPGRIFPTSPTLSLLSHQHILSGPYISYKFYVVTAKSPGHRESAQLNTPGALPIGSRRSPTLSSDGVCHANSIVPRAYGLANPISRALVTVTAGMKGRGKREIPEETRRPAESTGAIPKCKKPVSDPAED